MSRAPVSVVIPTLDEESHIAGCLACLGWADEAIVIDSGSRDRTAAIAASAGARVSVRPFSTWGEQRNQAARLARHDWILCVDADERVSEALGAEISALAGRGFDRPGYRIRRVATFAGRPLRHSGWGRDRVLRLYDRRRGAWDGRLVHEKVVIEGRPGELRGVLLHHTARDLFHAADKERRYAALGAEQLRREGRTSGSLDLLLRPALRFVKMYLVDRGFLDGGEGLLVSALGSYGVFLKYARLRELSRPERAADAGREPRPWP